MAEIDLVDVGSGIASSGISALPIILVVLLLGGVIVFLYMSGAITRRPFRLIILAERAHGGFVTILGAQARTLPNGKAEIFYGMKHGSRKDISNMVDDEYIHSGNIIYLFRSADNFYTPLNTTLSDEKLEFEATFSHAAKLSLADQIKKSVHRFTQPNPLEKYFPMLALLVGFMIVGIALYLSSANIAAGMSEVASQYNKVADKLENAQVVIQKAPPKDNDENPLLPKG